MSQPTRATGVAVIFALAVSAASCGVFGGSGWDGDALGGTRDSLETYDPAEALSIPTIVALSQSGRSGERPLDAVVIGRVIDVEPGRSMSWTLREDGADRVFLPFGDEGAEASTFHLTVDISEVVVAGKGTTVPSDEITVGVSHPAEDAEAVQDDYRGIGEAVFFVYQDSALYDYADDVWAIDHNQGLIGRLSGDGEIDFPLLPHADRPEDISVPDLVAWTNLG